MIRINLGYFYDLGQTLNYLRQIAVGTMVKDIWYPLGSAERALREFFTESVFSASLRTSFIAGDELIELLSELSAHNDTEYKIGALEAVNLARALSKLETILKAELASSDAYFVSSKRGYDTLSLVTQGELIFPEGIEAKVPEAIQDLREAGKCIAFELGTAAGFHVLRATESVVLRYYDVISNGEPRPTNRNLGQYIKVLKEKDADPAIVAALTQLKDLHRNELFHPERSITTQEAMELIGMVQSLAGAMLRYLPEVNDDFKTPEALNIQK